MTEQRSRRRTVVIVALLLAVAAVVVLLLLGGGTPRRIVHRPGVNHTLKHTPAARPAVAATNKGEVGAIAAARQYAQSFPTGRHAYGYRVLSFKPRKALVEFIAPENINGTVRWWIFDVPVAFANRWRVGAWWMTLDAAGSPPPPLSAYKPWPS